MSVDQDNAGFSSGSVVRMDEQRSRRFLREITALQEEVQSLASAGKCFPDSDLKDGQMHPGLTVRAFTGSMEKRLFLLWAMLNDDERSMPDLEEEGEA